MKNTIRTTRIRTRLLLAYGSILLIGFAILTIVAGSQISAAARVDYEGRLRNEIQLIAQGIQPYFAEAIAQDTVDEVLETLLADYETQIDAELTFIQWSENEPRPYPRSTLRDMPELEASIRDEIVIVERINEFGIATLYTAAPLRLDADSRFPQGLIQLAVPKANLQTLVLQRWALLWLIFTLIAGLGLAATIWVSRSIIQPLIALRKSALLLSQGDFSQRVTYAATDEIGQVAAAFNEMAQQVESMLEEQRAFASNTSHELRTPMTTIRLRSEALRYEALDTETTQQYITEIDDEVQHLGVLIEDLTLLSRFDAGRAELGNSEIDMRRFANNLIQQMQAQADAKQIQLTVDLPTTTVPVHASLNHLMVVFRNVLDNAIKYTGEGGTITCLVSIGLEGVTCIIEDSGQGIDTDNLPHLFERFYRADKARSRNIPGTGLGLALVQSIVNAYHGSITVDSAGLQQGTTVTIYWPYRQTIQ